MTTLTKAAQAVGCVAVAALIGLAAGCGGTSTTKQVSQNSTEPSPQQLFTSYYQAIVSGDGTTACNDMMPALQKATVKGITQAGDEGQQTGTPLASSCAETVQTAPNLFALPTATPGAVSITGDTARLTVILDSSGTKSSEIYRMVRTGPGEPWRIAQIDPAAGRSKP